jgi:hypothetical protein
MEDPVRIGKPNFLCPRDWGMHSCMLAGDHKGTHLCVCGERMGPADDDDDHDALCNGTGSACDCGADEQ